MACVYANLGGSCGEGLDMNCPFCWWKRCVDGGGRRWRDGERDDYPVKIGHHFEGSGGRGGRQKKREWWSIVYQLCTFFNLHSLKFILCIC